MYRVIRMYQELGKKTKIIKKGLTLKEAQSHCSDPETSSSTCKQNYKNLSHINRHGAWFDGYEEEK